MTNGIDTLRRWIQESDKIVFFGGAGVSTESGIPDFRSAHGLYAGAQGKTYEEMLHISFFNRHPDEFWRFYKDVMLYPDAQPNAAHRALARLEAQGKLTAVLTQNIDGLHQSAGSKHVWELHGSVLKNHCLSCGRFYSLKSILEKEGTPRCSICNGLIKPVVTLYGEALDEYVISSSINAIEECDLLIVGGTSLTVYPAAGLIQYRSPKCRLVLINRDSTDYDAEADLVIHENIADILNTVIPQ